MNRQVDVKALVSHIIRGDGIDKCRICLGDTSQGQVHLGDTVMMDGDKPVTLSELLELITGVAIEWTPSLPPRVCRTCTTSISNFMPFFLLCRESAYKWDQTTTYLSNVTVNNQATTAYVLLGDNPQTIVDRSTTTNKTPKDVIKNIKSRLSVIRRTRKPIKSKIAPFKGRGAFYFFCPDCKKGAFDKLYKFNFHLNVNRKHCCPHCFKIISITEYGDHLAEHDLPSYECNVCHLHFDKETRLIKHKVFHNRGKFECYECKYTYSSMDRLTSHTNVVHAKTRCDCDKIFYSRNCYLGHKRRMCPMNAKQMFVCDYCSKEFNRKFIIRQHIQNFHSTPVYTDQCDQCGKRFKSKAHLIEHSYSHEKILDRFTCEYCGKNYSTRRGYTRHMTKKHYQVNPTLYKKKKYPCQICHKILTSEINLENHTRRQHTKTD